MMWMNLGALEIRWKWDLQMRIVEETEIVLLGRIRSSHLARLDG